MLLISFFNWKFKFFLQNIFLDLTIRNTTISWIYLELQIIMFINSAYRLFECPSWFKDRRRAPPSLHTKWIWTFLSSCSHTIWHHTFLNQCTSVSLHPSRLVVQLATKICPPASRQPSESFLPSGWYLIQTPSNNTLQHSDQFEIKCSKSLLHFAAVT